MGINTKRHQPWPEIRDEEASNKGNFLTNAHQHGPLFVKCTKNSWKGFRLSRKWGKNLGSFMVPKEKFIQREKHRSPASRALARDQP
jgi:hypothetical protein